jgi:hypothetical protein
MSLKLRRFAQILGILGTVVAFASPAVVNAEPHGGGGEHGRGGGRAGARVFVGHGFAGRGGAGHVFVGHPNGARVYVGGRDHRGFVGDHAGRDRDRYRDWGHDRAWGYRPNWGGGWWGGYYWPRAYYGWDFPWFLAALPVGVVTYWWAGVPYYYVNDVYYIWNPTDDGYVVADPPPVADSGQSWYSDPPASSNAPPSSSAQARSGPDDVYMYPEHGQSTQQQSTDRYECHKWAEQQTGFDPTRPASQSSGSGSDYHRALVACLKGRGYSVD